MIRDDKLIRLLVLGARFNLCHCCTVWGAQRAFGAHQGLRREKTKSNSESPSEDKEMVPECACFFHCCRYRRPLGSPRSTCATVFACQTRRQDSLMEAPSLLPRGSWLGPAAKIVGGFAQINAIERRHLCVLAKNGIYRRRIFSGNFVLSARHTAPEKRQSLIKPCTRPCFSRCFDYCFWAEFRFHEI